MTKRLFAVPPGGVLAVPVSDFTSLETNTVQEILTYARDPEHRGREMLRCLSMDGNDFHDQSSGFVAEAEVTERMRDAIRQNKGVRLWHNHPSQTSLSHKDWWNTSVVELTEVLALNNSGSIFVGRIAEWEDKYEKLLKEGFVRIATDVEFEMDLKAKDQDLDPTLIVDIPIVSGHVLNLGMAAENVVHYACGLSSQDQSLFDMLNVSGVVEAGLSLARERIRDFL